MNEKFSYKINESKSKMRENTYTEEELNLIISEKEERSLDNASSLKYKEDYYVLADLKTGEIITFPTRTKCMVTIAYDGTYWGYVNDYLYQLVKIEKPKEEELCKNLKKESIFKEESHHQITHGHIIKETSKIVLVLIETFLLNNKVKN